MKHITAWLLSLGFLVSLAGAQRPLTVSAADAPGTQITNSASATYKDANGNSYTTTSNVVTTVVQNAPSLTNTAGTGTNYAPAQQVTDTFVLANTGNASGYLQLTGDATLGGTDAASATLGNGASTCTTPAGSQPAACKYAATVGATTYYFTSYNSTTDNNALNYWLKNTNPLTASGSSVTISVYYTLASNAATGSSNTVTSSITANITYAAAASAPSETSANQSGTQTNTVQADARLDLYKSSSQNGTTGDITYTISAHNGGAFGAKDLQSVKTLLGAAAAGVLVSDRVPQFGGSPLKLSNTGAVTVTTNATYGFASAAVADTYYTTSATGTTGWTKATGNLPTDGSVTYIAIFIHGGSCSSVSGFELCADTAHATNPGNVNVASAAALQFSFVVAAPSGSGSGNAGAVTNIGNGVIGDNQPTEHILGPGIPGATADSTSSSALTTSGQGINNTTNTSTGGASNQTSDKALAAYNVQNGPSGQPASSGSYDGSAAANASDDFTAVSFGISTDSITNTGTTAGTPVTAATTGSATTLCVAGTIKNSGNKDDSYNITAYAPTAFAIPGTGGQSFAGTFSAGGTQLATWTVGVYSNNTCSSALGGAAAASSSSTAANVAVTSGSTLTYYIGYTAPSGTAYFTRFDSLVHAVSVGDATKSDDTHDELYSSFVALTKSQSITSTNCPSGASPAYGAGTVCTGDSIGYTLDYRNLVLGTSDTNVSFAACTTQTGSGNALVITDDGTVSSSSSSTTQNNWGYFTTGLQSAPADKSSSASARTGTAFQYATGTPHGTFGATFGAGSTAFQVTPGGTSFSLVPKNYNSPSSSQDWQGTITFSLTVK
ncbi:MAG TPA: hypothetical protein VJP85_14685 [Candidatus Baltobacteraceae bacterium]|nr:hypothetical protein [Candidatus Baltobacteraceae bacterium]